MSHPHLSVGGCPACLRITPAGPLGFLPLIPLSWRQEKWRTRMAATHLLPSPKVSSHRQQSLLSQTFFFKHGRAVIQTITCRSEGGVSFEFVRVWTLNAGGDWSPRSRVGHGSGINYQATHSTGCCTFVSHELLFSPFEPHRYCQFYGCRRHCRRQIFWAPQTPVADILSPGRGAPSVWLDRWILDVTRGFASFAMWLQATTLFSGCYRCFKTYLIPSTQVWTGLLTPQTYL